MSVPVWGLTWVKARNLPLGCHEPGILRVLALREALHLTSPIGSLPVEVRHSVDGPPEHDAAAIRCPHGLPMVSRVERQARQRVARPFVDPHVQLPAVADVHREPAAVGREGRIEPGGGRGA